MHQQTYRISNLLFGTSHVSNLADVDNFMDWLTASPIHCHIVLCEKSSSKVAVCLMECSSASDHPVLKSKDVVFVTACLFIVLLRRRATLAGVRQVLTFDDICFAVVHVNIHERSAAVVQGHSTAVAVGGHSTAVAVGVVHVMPAVSTLPEWLMNSMYESVHLHGVRCFTGTFGLVAQQMTRWVAQFPMATRYPVCQMWQGSGSAIDHTRSPGSPPVDVFPSYTLLLGTAGNVTIPAHSDLLPSAVAVQKRWACASFPWEMVMPEWCQWAPHEVERSLAGDMDWGHIKMKKVDAGRWIADVHQVLFWCGTAQIGHGVRARKALRRAEGQAASSLNP